MQTVFGMTVVGFLNKRGIEEQRSAKQIRDKLSIISYQDRMKLMHIFGAKNFIADALTRRLSGQPQQPSHSICMMLDSNWENGQPDPIFWDLAKCMLRSAVDYSQQDQKQAN